jgi:hypothetical protein
VLASLLLQLLRVTSTPAKHSNWLAPWLNPALIAGLSCLLVMVWLNPIK